MSSFNQQQQYYYGGAPSSSGFAAASSAAAAPGGASANASMYGQQQQQQQSMHPSAAGGYFGNISPEMLNIGLSAGRNMLTAERERWMPGVSTFWASLKIYFAVSGPYVSQKLRMVVWPFANQVWSRRAYEDAGGSLSPMGDSGVGDMGSPRSHKWATPNHDVNAPDLYIPLMSFLTYLLLLGAAKGAAASAEDGFTPDFLTQALWRCLVLQMIECFIIKFCLSLIPASLPFLDIISYTGYKYVALCLATIALFFGSTVYVMVSLFLCVALGFFVLKSMAAAVPMAAPGGGGGPPRHLLLLACSALQFAVALLLCWV